MKKIFIGSLAAAALVFAVFAADPRVQGVAVVPSSTLASFLSAIANAVVNSGTPLTGAIPVHADTTGTNTIPSKVTITGLTNVLSGTLLATNKVTAGEGLASAATDAAVTIDATGWTNTFAKNAVVYFSGTNVTYTVFNNAGTAIYTNLNQTGMIDSSVLLQTSGKVIISGTAVFGRATPF